MEPCFPVQHLYPCHPSPPSAVSSSPRPVRSLNRFSVPRTVPPGVQVSWTYSALGFTFSGSHPDQDNNTTALVLDKPNCVIATYLFLEQVKIRCVIGVWITGRSLYMRKIMNAPKDFVDDFLDGLLKAYPLDFRSVPGFARAITRVEPNGGDSKVAIVTGGGSGHLPLFLGYVGQGLCSAVAVGNTFSSPSAETILAATKASESGKGVLYLYGNYSGDCINFDDAADMASEEGIEIATVRAADDVASAPPVASGNRRAVAGLTLAYKCTGAAAAAGYTLSQTAAVAARSLANTRTMGVGLSPTIIPEAGRPTFQLSEDEMELGIGIHGEPGVRREQSVTRIRSPMCSSTRSR